MLVYLHLGRSSIGFLGCRKEIAHLVIGQLVHQNRQSFVPEVDKKKR